MARATFHSSGPRRALIAAALVASILALLPARFIGWVSWFSTVTVTVIAPIKHPFAALSRWVRPAETDPPGSAIVEGLEREREQYQTLYLREADENARLRELIKELQRGVELNRELPVTQITAPVIGSSSDPSSGLLRVRAGRREGVETNTVAVTSGIQLLGRVVSASARACLVQPITSRGSTSELLGRVMGENGAPGLACTLSPVGDGTLRGPVEHSRDGTGAAIAPKPGAVVRLDDPHAWPANAQMLVIGTVERVEPSPEQPLRSIITVRPGSRLDRVSEVILRVPTAPGAAEDDQ